MSLQIKIGVVFCIVFFLFSCRDNAKKSSPFNKQEAAVIPSGYASTKHLIEAEELLNSSGDPHIKIVHFGKKNEYDKGHIKGALPIWRTDIEDASYPFNGMLCAKDQLEELCSNLGIKNTDTIIVYDGIASCDATRLWWAMANYGFFKLKILNGGLKRWVAIGGELSTEKPSYEKSNFVLPKEAPMDFHIARIDVHRAVDKQTTTLLIDTRTINEYTGIRKKNGASKAGRIPTSLTIDWVKAVNYDGDHKFKTYAALERLYGPLIPDKEQAVIAYCHSGYRSAHTTFVLSQLLGYKNVKNYDGSWLEWSRISDNPMEKDSITTIFE